MSLSRIIRQNAEACVEPFVYEPLGGNGETVIRTRAEQKKEAEEIKARATLIEREAYERGFRAGEKAGFDFGRQKADAVFNAIGKLLGELTSFRENLFKPCEREMVDICLAIARKVTHSETEGRREIVIDAVRAALKAATAAGDIVIRVNPKDLDTVKEYRPEILKSIDGVKSARIEAEESISRGGCRVETNFGEIDATIDSALAEIEERLRNA